jgi:exodeoxyribonuclease VII small subunit
VIVQRLESGGVPLEESTGALWERGEQLAAICQSLARRREGKDRGLLGRASRQRTRAELPRLSGRCSTASRRRPPMLHRADQPVTTVSDIGAGQDQRPVFARPD